LVAEEGLNLRDGPGITYVGMTKLTAGTQLDLLARYNDWLQVQTADGQAGWVLGQYLTVVLGVVEHVEVVTSIPDPNPSLVGATRERNISRSSRRTWS
jgi:N-acetylmuramoyl-L-alanine amidase